MGGHANQAAECLGALQHRDECLPETEAHVIPVEVATGHLLMAAPRNDNEADRKGTTNRHTLERRSTHAA